MMNFTALIKPASSRCNMRCGYCFYADEAASRNIYNRGIMSRDTAHNLIDRVYEYVKPGSTVHFGFQGGEPTVAGLDFFEDFTAYAESRARKKLSVTYSVQTNGLLLNDEWCEFLKGKKFLVGVSLDGDRQLHDHIRKDAVGGGTYDRVMSAIRLLEKLGVDYNILTVVTRFTARHPAELMSFYRRHKFGYVQLIPCLSPLDGTDGDAFAPSQREYADFLKRFFRLWLDGLQKDSYISVRQFDNLYGMLKGRPPEQCGMSGRCTPQFIAEADGSVYPCDFYALDRYLCGNVNKDGIEQTFLSDGMRAFAADFPPDGTLCAGCGVYAFCGGGCRRYRSFYYGKEGYCSNRDFLEYALPFLAKL